MSRMDQKVMEEAAAEAHAVLLVECPDVDLNVLDGASEAFEAGIWFGMAGLLTVMERHGIIRLPKDGESRE